MDSERGNLMVDLYITSIRHTPTSKSIKKYSRVTPRIEDGILTISNTHNKSKECFNLDKIFSFKIIVRESEHGMLEGEYNSNKPLDEANPWLS